MRTSLIICGAAALLAAAPLHAAQCVHSGQMTGSVVTTNPSASLQHGRAEIAVTREGRSWYVGSGVVIGQVVGRQDNGLPILDHTIYLDDGARIHSRGDVVQQMTPTGKFESGLPCEFYTVERIGTVHATRKLARLSNGAHGVAVTGTISYCSDDNRNRLELNGPVCFGNAAAAQRVR